MISDFEPLKMILFEQKKPSPRDLNSQDGIGLMMAILSSVVISGLLAGLGFFLSNRVHERSIDEIRRARDFVYKSVLQAASDPNAILISRQFDSTLNSCVTQANPLLCSQFKRFSLKIPLSTTASGKSYTLTAMTDADVLGMFDRSGYKTCSPVSKCAYIAETNYKLECPPAGGSCAEGGFLRIRVQVRKNSSWLISKSFQGFTGLVVGTKSSGDDSSDAIVYLKDINRVARQSCPEGAFATGIDLNGRVACRCGGSYVQNTAIPLSCRLLNRCPQKQVLIGYDANLSPICKPISLTRGDCRALSQVSGTAATAKCPNSGFIYQAVPSGDCNIIGYDPKNPKANPGTVSCPPWTIYCCTLPGNS